MPFKIETNPEYASDPMDWDLLGTFGIVARNLSFGQPEGENLVKKLFDESESREELEKKLWKAVKPAYCRRLYAYIHSGVVLSTNPNIGWVHHGWDTLPIGYMWVTAERIREAYGVTRITKAVREKVQNAMHGELQAFEDYLNGAVVSWSVTVTDWDGITIYDDYGLDTQEDAMKCAYDFIETLDM